MIEIINKGGPINWIIVVIYFVVVGICIERGFYFYFTRTNYRKFYERLFFLLDKFKGRDEEVLKDNIFETWQNSPAAKISVVYFKNLKVSQALRTEIIEKEGSAEIGKMENYLGALSVIGHIAPLLGLLGTITGLIRAFQSIESLGGQVDVGDLSGGIWEAMLTTAAGLSLAIPAFLMFNFFTHLVNNRANEISNLVSSLNVYFDKKRSDYKVEIGGLAESQQDYDEIS